MELPGAMSFSIADFTRVVGFKPPLQICGAAVIISLIPQAFQDVGIKHVPRKKFGGEGGIRTHGTQNAHTISSRAHSTTLAPLQLDLHR